MPALLVALWVAVRPLLFKAAISVGITLLEKSGTLSTFQADMVRAGEHVITTVESVKTYSNNNQLDPAKSDFPAQVHNEGR